MTLVLRHGDGCINFVLPDAAMTSIAKNTAWVVIRAKRHGAKNA